MIDGLITGQDGIQRCGWCGADPLYISYHDSEWGKSVLDDPGQFEFLVLESAQAGLSWITILRKREAYRKAYANFNPEEVATWGEDEVLKLLENAGIVRNRRKIEASFRNAKLFLEISREHGSFSSWLLSFYGGKPRINNWESMSEVPTTTQESENIAQQMKKIGFSFFGPVIAYAHLQATGIVNDHIVGCHCHRQ